MDTEFTTQGGQLGEGHHGYPRALVDDFLAAAGRERERLEELRRDASLRAERARATIGVHRVMMAMMLDTQREVSEIRRAADAEATATLADAEQQVEAILGCSIGAIPDPGSPHGRAFGAAGPETTLVDLTAVEISESTSPGEASELSHVDDHKGVEQYFEFLRGALIDEQPLGPRPEQTATGR